MRADSVPAGPGKDYVDKLGRWSSHPYWLEAGSRQLRSLVGIVLVVVYLVLFWFWLRGSSLSTLVPNLFAWVGGWPGKLGLGLGFFLFGMLVGNSWLLRYAFYKLQRTDIQVGRESQPTISPPMAVMAFLVGIVLPPALTFFPGLPVEIRLIGPLLGFLPLALLSYVLPDPKRSPTKLPWLTRILLFGLAPIFWSVWFVASIAEFLLGISPDWLLGALPLLQLVDGWQRAAFALALACTVYGGLDLVRWLVMRRKQAQTDDRGSVSEQSEETPVVSGDPAWLQKLKEMLKARGWQEDALTVQELRPAPDELAASADNSCYEPLFGVRPTEDQHRILDEFMKLADVGGQTESAGEKSPGYAMVVEAPAGSGLSATFDALALLSILGKGANVVIFLADENRVDLAINRIRRKLGVLELQEFLQVGTFNDAKQCLEHDRALPEILVTTPDVWDEGVTGSPVSPRARKEQIEPLLKAYATILVDDWAQYPTMVALHLPFIVDKWRLIRDAWMRASACVYAFPKLSDAGRQLVLDRVFGHGSLRRREGQYHRLRYYSETHARVLDIRDDDIDALIEQAVELAAESAESVLLFRNGIDAEMAARQGDELKAKFPGSRVVVCYCADQVDAMAGAYSSIILRAADGQDAVFALGSRGGAAAPVIVRFKAKAVLPEPEGITPLIVDRTARGLGETHLLNALRFVDERTPVAKASWGQLGLQMPVRGSAPAQVGVRLHWDCAPKDPGDRPYLREVGDFLALDQPFDQFIPSDCWSIPEQKFDGVLFGGSSVHEPEFLDLSVLQQGELASCWIRWQGNDTSELGRTQLSYSSDLVFVGHRHLFAPENIVPTSEQQATVKAVGYRGDGTDAVHPKFLLDWQGNETPPEPPFGGPDHRYLWVERKADSCHDVNVTLLEVGDGRDRVTLRPNFKSVYRANVTGLLLLPSDFEDLDLHRRTLAELCSRAHAWGTQHEDFLPGLTYAMHRVLELDLPGSARLGRALAFRLTGGLASLAPVVIWFVEPLGVGNTLSRALKQLLVQPGYREHFSTRLDEALAGGWDKSPKEAVASFWLPKGRRHSISLFERWAATQLYDNTEAKSAEMRDEKRQRLEVIADIEVACPVCNQRQSSEFAARTVVLECCGKPIAYIVTSADRRAQAAHQLVRAWWPDEHPLPEAKLSGQDRILRAWQLVAEHTYYRTDWYLRENLIDCWLPPEVTWERGGGDCDDHAILLTAMLRKLGFTAWVTLGTVNGEGHAWVEVEFEGQEYRIEATSKPPLVQALPLVTDDSEYKYSDFHVHRFNETSYARYVGDGWEHMTLPEPTVTYRGEKKE